MSVFWLSLTGDPCEDGEDLTDRVSDRCVVLQPGDMYWNQTTELETLSPDAYRRYAAMEHYWRFGLWTDDAYLRTCYKIEELRQAWLRFGHLWTDGVRTKPLRLRLPDADTACDCSSLK